MKVLSFDVESNGLHGQAFAIGAVVTDENGTVTRYEARCPIDGPVNGWVTENVLPALADMRETHASYADILEDFYQFLQRYADATVLTFIPWPVESRVLSDIFASDETRWFQGPFPVIDLASVLAAKGLKPTSDEAYLKAHGLAVPFDGSAHHPLYDAVAAEVVFRHVMAA